MNTTLTLLLANAAVYAVMWWICRDESPLVLAAPFLIWEFFPVLGVPVLIVRALTFLSAFFAFIYFMEYFSPRVRHERRCARLLRIEDFSVRRDIFKRASRLHQ